MTQHWSEHFDRKSIPAQRSADGTHRFQPFQPSSKLVEKVDPANKLKTFFFTKKNTKSDEKKANQPNYPNTVDPRAIYGSWLTLIELYLSLLIKLTF